MIKENVNHNYLESLEPKVAQQSNVPSIPMSDSYNSAASRPVFSPDIQAKATSMFGTNDQRQIAANGLKKDEFIGS